MSLGDQHFGPFEPPPSPVPIDPVAGEWWTFMVGSRSHPDDPPHRVDLEEYDWNGACWCLGFRRHYLEPLEAGERDWGQTNKYRCWHIIFAIHWCWYNYVPQFADWLRSVHIPGHGVAAEHQESVLKACGTGATLPEGTLGVSRQARKSMVRGVRRPAIEPQTLRRCPSHPWALR